MANGRSTKDWRCRIRVHRLHNVTDETILLSVSDHSDLFHHTLTEWHEGADALAHRPRREVSSWRELQGQAAAVKVYFEVGVSDGSDGKVKHRVSAGRLVQVAYQWQDSGEPHISACPDSEE